MLFSFHCAKNHSPFESKMALRAAYDAFEQSLAGNVPFFSNPIPSCMPTGVQKNVCLVYCYFVNYCTNLQTLLGVGINENGIVKTITDESRIVETLTNFDADEYRLMSSNFKYDQSLGYIWKEKKRQSMKLEFQRIMVREK